MTSGSIPRRFPEKKGSGVLHANAQRLFDELRTNVSLVPVDRAADIFSFLGRGELHLAILIETMPARGVRVPGFPAGGDFPAALDEHNWNRLRKFTSKPAPSRWGVGWKARGGGAAKMMDMQDTGQGEYAVVYVPRRADCGFPLSISDCHARMG